MPNLPSVDALQKIAANAHIPAVGYAYVEPQEEGKREVARTSLTVGKKSAQSDDAVDADTRFSAASLSKIVFTYLVLQLAKAGEIDLDEPLLPILQHAGHEYERFKVDGEYPDKAKKLTARHVLSHTTGLPNVGADSSSPLKFDPESELGKTYSYSGEAFIYLQNVIEKKTGKNLEELAKKYVFEPLGMERSSFLPQPENDPEIVAVHDRLGKSSSIDAGLQGTLRLNAAGSLLTTADDFSKFIAAWVENMDDPLLQQAFRPTNPEALEFKTCGLGWHLYRDKDTDKVIAYQYGENTDMRSFVAINMNDKKGAAIFTNSEHGMSIGDQLLSTAPDFATIGNMNPVFKHLHYAQSDEPGWKEMLEGDIAEDQGRFDEAREHFEEALKVSPEGEAKQRIGRRLAWFNQVHPAPTTQFTQPLEAFVGKYKNPYGEEMEICIKNGGLIQKQFGQEIKLIRVSEAEFLPEKDQSSKISVNNGKMSIDHIDGWHKELNKQTVQKSQTERANLQNITTQYRDKLQKIRPHEPGHMAPTESSKAKEREKHVDTAPKPSWKP